MATFLPLKRSLVLVEMGPSLPITYRVAEGIQSPGLIVMFLPYESLSIKEIDSPTFVEIKCLKTPNGPGRGPRRQHRVEAIQVRQCHLVFLSRRRR